MRRLRALFRTTAVRLSALYLGLFAVCAIALVFYVTAMSGNLLRAQTQEAVVNELRFLSRGYQSGGITRLVRMVDRRSRQPGAGLYTIAAQNGEILAGNVASLQPGTLDREGWTSIPFSYDRYTDETDSARRQHEALAQIVFLPNGMRLLVGRDLGEPELFRNLVRRALVIALAVMCFGALAIWYFIGRRALQRIDGMSQASQKIMGGDLAQRLPVGGSGDEFDRLSESLNAMIARIERLNEGLRQVSDNIAHDLKTPLTRLRNRAEAALAGAETTEAYRRAMEEVIDESDQLIRTFNALLMIARVEAGSQVAELQTVSLSDIAADAAELYEPVAEDAGVRFSVDVKAGVSVKGNRELVGQALSNLIDNAIKYAGGGEAAEIRLSVEDDGERAVLTVADNGPGIPAEKRDEVIERFVRLDESRTKPGTGLGLSLVDAVMALHGGRLELADGIGNDASRVTDTPGLTARMIFTRN
ncbi:sensor histidine kinase [Pararhizobium haloflavum]|uniref:sensor histidine kinase n=1 Tax=Pararhizobium haloflavum TaxID=2037914 RepID=UPI000C17DB14|nr:HAMP domain-containing sensor histidine kinase [Pararhizobium haloflavum]